MLNRTLICLTLVMSLFIGQIVGQDNSQLSKDQGPEQGTLSTPEGHIVCNDGAYMQPLDPANFGTARTSDRGAGFSVADNFSFAVATDVTSVCWWGINVDFSGGVGPCASIPTEAQDAFEITYLADASGAPGAIFAGPFAVTSQKDPTGIAFAFTEIYQWEASHPSVSFDAGQTYYVQITNGAGACWFLWVDNTAAPNDGMAWQDSGSGFAPVGTDQVFNLGGAPTPVEIVPTMGEWAIISLGMILLIFGVVATRQRTLAIS